ncbi:MAG: hypothetical protein IKV87_03610 [Methanobrevibacter sp.]|nr:hypothetical protein [Methanobrevibacter sp.]
MTNGRNYNSLKMPNNFRLPFFAYGMFNLGEKAYSKIESYIEEKDEVEINYCRIKRDGVSILLPEEDVNCKTNGYILHFNDNKKAYKKISDLSNSDKFIWSTISIGEEKVNVLILRGPKNIYLPFFTYGIFKPGEIAYSNIKCCIDHKNEENIPYLMKERDGVPILLPKENERYKTKGYLYYFNDNEESYKRINKTIPYELYSWNTINIGEEEVNVLFGKDPKKGSNVIEDMYNRDNFKGKNDPLFVEGLRLVKENLKSGHYAKVKGFFQLQMNYMLLWSAIDRYCKLKYNRESEFKNREELSKEKLFEDALSQVFEGKFAKYDNIRNYRPIFTTDDLTRREFDINKARYCMNYFYTLRCNIVHRGKSNFKDVNLLYQATWDLLDIFEYILNETFNEE